MTAQLHEQINFNGKTYGMASTPLSDYLKNHADTPKFAYPHTACWRGYLGTWEIRNNRLFLIDLVCYIKLEPLNEIIESDLSLLFPGKKVVFAKWFTGVIRIPDGQIINYVHAGFASTYEEDLFVTFKNGILIDFYTIENHPDIIDNELPKSFFAKIKRIIMRINLFKK